MSKTQYDENDLVSISALEKFSVCPRQCALIFNEGIWKDNSHTVIGTLLHEIVDKPGFENDDGTKSLRALPLFSKILGLVGKADIVEFHEGNPTPVEYKKGKRKKWMNDEVQLCAQALCLEEMFCTKIPHGYIYHAGSKKRREVFFDEVLRNKTLRMVEEVRKMIQSASIPHAELKPQCEGCSLHQVCLPELKAVRTKDYQKVIWNS